MSVAILRGDARRLPLPDASVDLIATSPPYWRLRDYRDGDTSMDGQIGSEPTWQEWLANLVDCTREWVRVLKPTGSLFVNCGDKYSSAAGPQTGKKSAALAVGAGTKWATTERRPPVPGFREKSLLGLPWRYALACTDQLGLILRAEIIWAKPNGLPESVTDRVRRSHEQIFHLVRSPRYYTAIDEIREAQAEAWRSTGRSENRGTKAVNGGANQGFGLSGVTPREYNPLGKLPGSVWTIPSQPLSVPPALGVDHFAAFPVELPRRIVLGWSPPGICVACGQGRRPVADSMLQRINDTTNAKSLAGEAIHPANRTQHASMVARKLTTITGYVCACTPYTDHPERRGVSFTDHAEAATMGQSSNGSERNKAYREGRSGPSGPVREYHLDNWRPPPTRPAVVLDPFMGTGTTLLAADVYGRHAIGVDRSADYCRLARWRVHDPGERAKAMQVPKPPPVPDGMDALF